MFFTLGSCCLCLVHAAAQDQELVPLDVNGELTVLTPRETKKRPRIVDVSAARLLQALRQWPLGRGLVAAPPQLYELHCLLYATGQWSQAPGSQAVRQLYGMHCLMSDLVPDELIVPSVPKAHWNGSLSAMEESSTWAKEWSFLAGSLSRDDPQVLIPLIALHRQLQGLELAQWRLEEDPREYLRVQVTESLILSLLHRYLELIDDNGKSQATAQSEDAHFLVSLFWTSLAASYLDLNFTYNASFCLDMAAKLSPKNLAALHTQGVVLGKRGDHKAAAKILAAYLKRRPNQAEVRLRYALTVLRLGKRSLARKRLQELVSNVSPEWVCVLAYQELAQLSQQPDLEGDARDLLTRGLEEHPDNERLAIQLLQVSNPGSPTAREILDGILESKPGSTTLTPRARFNLWPSELESALQQLDIEVSRQLPQLLRALERGGSS